jgi:hypothetical protein
LGGRPVTIGVAADLKPLHTEFDSLMARYTQVSLVMFALLVVLQIGIVRLALAPLRRIQADVKRLERGEIAQLGERVPAEVLPLVREVNRLLALLARRLQRSRESLGNLAHALKTPLTVLTHMADDDRVRHDPVLGPQMAAQVGILRSRIDAELRRARVAGGRAAGAPLDLPAELDALAATLRKLYRERELTRLRAARRGVSRRPRRLAGVVRQPARQRLQMGAHRVVISRRRERSVADGRDDGPGCSPEDLTRITRRGVRPTKKPKGTDRLPSTAASRRCMARN